MREKVSLTTGRWWRFSKYEVRDGYIRPARGANLETYDPWRTDPGDETTNRPYLAMVKLLPDVAHRVWPPPKDKPVPVDAETDALLTAWCERYGMLGLLPHKALMASLAPRWTVRQKEHGAVPVQRHYVRTHSDWLTIGGGISDKFDSQPGPLVQRNHLPSNVADPGVVMQQLEPYGIGWEPLHTTWSGYFPMVKPAEANTHPYPRPLSATFWKVYAEPVWELVRTIAYFHQVLERLTRGPHEEESPEDIRARLERGTRELETLIMPVGPVLRLTQEQAYRQEWTAPSLLATFAMMVVNDLTGGQTLHSCEVCHNLFTSDAWQAKYCSKRCRWTAQQRSYRMKRRRKESSTAANVKVRGQRRAEGNT